ncbi:hypothetical protein I602_2431 [Polaribacter dokdonensis DSW-5]|uniref:Uncharacterized protein n=1 Tax=Polaribacter dokdonensis DSW-5 TaxID=1300348 RepID=A0A0M9CHR3_9FLAO|nr:hypothetical protein I602_2431 [Polaribacter dokdonensis DSW-5]
MKNQKSLPQSITSKIISLSDTSLKLFILSLSVVFLFESLF